MSGISGGYPGGPPRHDPEGQTADSDGPELRDGESVEASVADHAVRRKKKLRNRRLVIGLVTSIITAAGVGAYLGLQSRTTAEELAQETMEEEENELDPDKELDRLINELWKMEDLERANRR